MNGRGKGRKERDEEREGETRKERIEWRVGMRREGGRKLK